MCQYYAARVYTGHIVNLTFIGCADARYYEDYNEKLAQRRIEAVINQILMTLKDVHGVTRTVSLKFNRDARGEKGTVDHWSHYAEDRRVEIIDTRASSVDAPKKSEVYTLKDFEDGRLFRADMFFVERWNRQWRKWWPLNYLIKDFEQKDYIHEGKVELIPLSESDLDNIERLMKAIAPHLSTKIQNDIATKGRKEALREIFFVEFRNAWKKVQDLALKDYNKSDFRYFHEFMAVVLGKVATGGYAKKPSASE